MASDKHLIARDLRAFTFLGANIKLSILGDALTVYLEPNESILQKWQNAELQIFLQYGFSVLPRQNILRDPPAHDKYHQDSFEMERDHGHFQYKTPLDGDNLLKILKIYYANDLISFEEMHNCHQQYNAANRLTQVEVDASFACAQLKEVKTAFAQFQSANGANKKDIETKLTLVLARFAQIIDSGEHLVKAQEYLKAIEDTFTSPTPENIQKLKVLGQQASNMSSVLWRALGCALMLLATAIFVVACLHISFGITGALVGFTGISIFNQGLRQVRHPYLKNDELSNEIIALSHTLSPSV